VNPLTARIRSLEAVARRLDPQDAERAALLQPVVDYGNRFLDGIATRPMFVEPATGATSALDAPFLEGPSAIGDLLHIVDTEVDTPGLNPASAGHLGYIPGGGLFHSALGDFLAAVTNRYSGVFFASPGAVRMENRLLRWMGDLVGYPSTAVGNLTSGGSIGNLIGVVSARDAQGISSKMIERAPIYLTRHVHHSVDKALRIAGLDECPIRHVPMDGRYRMDADALERLVTPKTKLIVVNTPHNPTGAMLSPADAARVYALAESVGAWVIGDEAYRWLSVPGGDPFAPPVVDMGARGISVGTLSKPYGLPGLRIGWMAGPRDVIERCWGMRDYITLSPGKLNDALACLALRHHDKIVERNRGIITTNLAAATAWIDSRQEDRSADCEPHLLSALPFLPGH